MSFSIGISAENFSAFQNLSLIQIGKQRFLKKKVQKVCIQKCVEAQQIVVKHVFFNFS